MWSARNSNDATPSPQSHRRPPHPPVVPSTTVTLLLLDRRGGRPLLLLCHYHPSHPRLSCCGGLVLDGSSIGGGIFFCSTRYGTKEAERRSHVVFAPRQARATTTLTRRVDAPLATATPATLSRLDPTHPRPDGARLSRPWCHVDTRLDLAHAQGRPRRGGGLFCRRLLDRQGGRRRAHAIGTTGHPAAPESTGRI